MKVILLQDVKKVGKKYEVKEVAGGYAQNNLIPKKLAIPATPESMRKLQQQIKSAEKSDELMKKAVLDNLSALDGVVVEVTLKANDKGSLYAKLHATEVANYVKEIKSIDINPDHVELENVITEIGEHTLKVTAFGKTISFTLSIKAE